MSAALCNLCKPSMPPSHPLAFGVYAVAATDLSSMDAPQQIGEAPLHRCAATVSCNAPLPKDDKAVLAASQELLRWTSLLALPVQWGLQRGTATSTHLSKTVEHTQRKQTLLSLLPGGAAVLRLHSEWADVACCSQEPLSNGFPGKHTYFHSSLIPLFQKLRNPWLPDNTHPLLLLTLDKYLPKSSCQTKPRNIRAHMLDQTNDLLAISDHCSTLIPCSTMLLHKMLMKVFLVVGAEKAQAANIPIQRFIHIISAMMKNSARQSFPNAADGRCAI